MTSIEELKNLLASVRKDSKEKGESLPLLERVTALYSACTTAENPFPDPHLESYFFRDFSPELIQSVLNFSVLTKAEVTVWAIVV